MSHARKVRLLFLLVTISSVFLLAYEGNFLLVSDSGKCFFTNFSGNQKAYALQKLNCREHYTRALSDCRPLLRR